MADRNINTLIEYRYARIHRAKHGENGHGADKYGRGADDILLRVPVGTMITDADTGAFIADLAVHGQQALVAQGGKGGLGNIHFKSSTNRAPRQFTPGDEGQKRRLHLELKVLADVGLLGLPNAGKSTFIRAVSAARPKVADYPFTTLAPNLGVVRTDENRSFVVADIPGLIEGAADGAGLGHQFLRHLQRTRMLLHIVDIAPFDPEADPVRDARAIVAELKRYDVALFEKPRWLVLNKIDLVPENERDARVRAFVKAYGWKGPVFAVAAVNGEGCRALVFKIQDWLDAHPAPAPAAAEPAQHWVAAIMSTPVASARRLVVKVGSSLVTNDGRGLDHAAVDRWATQIAELRRAGREIVLVSSGAIAEGVKRLGWTARPSTMHELQAAAAVGQMGLVQAYESAFARFGLHTAQILLTHDDLADRRRYLNARSTLFTLLALDVIPIINENDTVTTDEIRFGDNDTLGALVTNLIEADVLVLLTDQPGLFTADPRRDPAATLVRTAQAGEARLEAMAGGAGSAVGRGGMLSKVLAAKRAARSGASTVIANGREENVLTRLAAGEEIGTSLCAPDVSLGARKQWLADHVQLAGRLTLDAGAVRALVRDGKSLLPIGVVGVDGNFERGEIVGCFDPDGREVARGLVNYSAPETARILRKPSSEIAAILGYIDEPELIHRNNLVLLG